MNRKFFQHTISEIWDENSSFESSTNTYKVTNPYTGKLVKRKLHRSNVNYNGKKAEYILLSGIKYFVD